MTVQKKLKGTGRPAGATNASPPEKIRRNLHQIHDALLKSALAGDADAIRLCFEVAQDPKKFPLPDGRQR